MAVRREDENLNSGDDSNLSDSGGLNNNIINNNNNSMSMNGSHTMMMEVPAVETESPRDRTGKPLVVGVFGGAFNPIHSGHVLLAVTVLETQPVDEVVIVPVFKHPVKSDLLPFEDRVQMCRLATIGTGVRVSTVEERIGASNDKMLRGIKDEYPPGTKLVWICGDDVFDWIHNPLGQAMLEEVRSMVVQRRLCRAGDSEVAFDESPFNWEAMEEQKKKHGLEISVIDGKMPHVSSTLVRSSSSLWRAYLPQLVAFYLDSRPKLLAHLVGCPNPLRRGGGLAPQEPAIAKVPSGGGAAPYLLGARAIEKKSTPSRTNDLGKINHSCPLPMMYLEEPEFESD